MLNKIFFLPILFSCLFIPCFSYAQDDTNSLLYIGQKAPNTTPEIFASDFITYDWQTEFGSVFSKDGKEFFFAHDTYGKAEIKYSKLENGVWTEPEVILSHEKFGMNDPMLNPSEDKLYFISNMSLEEGGEARNHDIYYVERQLEGWSEPIRLDEPINTDSSEYYISFTEEGTLYFASNRNAEEGRYWDHDIYVAHLDANGDYTELERLPKTVNTRYYEGDAFVAPDESYLIFCTVRKEGYRGDLYISFKNEDGTWSEAKDMGFPINDENHQLCPFVTADGDYLFYTSQQDIYWVSAAVLEQFRE